ncbi:MAG: peptidase [Anaerolineae bacterium]|nr:peptidase [Anaerolineae bacterium]
MNTIEQRVLDAIDIDGMLTYLCDLIAIRSLDGEETEAQRHMAAKMEEIGLDVDMWDIDMEALEQHPAFSAEVERETGVGLVGTLGQELGGRNLIFNGHIDVVPTGDAANWHYPPWQGTIDNGNLYGRGGLDMKGGLCCALYAAKAILDAGIQLKGKLMVESVIGEEDGGTGTLATVLRGYRADGAVVPEPTNMAIITAQAGAMNFRVTVPGYSAHGCMRLEGVSAVEKFIPIYQALLELESHRNENVTHPLLAKHLLPYPLSVGIVKAGDWPSSVPESLVFEGRYGVAVGEDMLAARQAFEEAVIQVAQRDPWLKDHPPTVEWWGGQFESASIPTDHAIVQTVQSAYNQVTNTAPHIEGVTYGADMRLLVNQGQIPTVLFGPGDVRNAHQPDEYVPVADLITVTRSLALTALRFCGYEED